MTELLGHYNGPRCKVCGGQPDYPMLIGHGPRALCADEFHEAFYMEALGRKPKNFWQRLVWLFCGG